MQRKIIMYGNRIAILCVGLSLIIAGPAQVPAVENKGAGQIICTGKIVDEQGRPIAGAKVSLYQREYN